MSKTVTSLKKRYENYNSKGGATRNRDTVQLKCLLKVPILGKAK